MSHRFSESTFFILLALAPAPIHGYAIMKEVERLSDGQVPMSTGTLYGALKRLLEEGWIQRTGDDVGGSGGGRIRKSYELSGAGRAALQSESARLQSLVTLARRRLVTERG